MLFIAEARLGIQILFNIGFVAVAPFSKCGVEDLTQWSHIFMQCLSVLLRPGHEINGCQIKICLMRYNSQEKEAKTSVNGVQIHAHRFMNQSNINISEI